MEKIIVAGCGVSGLTTAIVLQESGHEVSIITKELADKTTSAKAAAIWLPFEVEPLELVNKWSRDTYHALSELSQNAQSGVSMVDFIILSTDGHSPSWQSAVPTNALRKAKDSELPDCYKYGFVATVPLIETPIYLNYLVHRFKSKGGQISIQNIISFTNFLADGYQVVNCTGLGSRVLIGDNSLYPIKGNIAKIEKIENLRYIADDDGPNALSYVIPRKDGIILGGTASLEEDQIPDDKEIRAFIARCKNIEPGIDQPKIIETWAGLRPGRPQIRLERTNDGIIHNYGHGGGGFTVSWGCSKEVLRLLEAQ